MAIDWTEADVDVLGAIIRARGIETDLSNAVLVAHAAAARSEIAARIGATHEGLVRYLPGGSSIISVHPPIGTIDTVTENGVELELDTDFRIRGDGSFLERIADGYARRWVGEITVTYDAGTPGDRYDRVVIDLIKLAIEYSGLDSRRDGDYAEESKGARGGGGQHNYQLEREILIDELVAGSAGFA